MPVQALFGINVAFGFVAWGIVTASVIWPELRARPREEALRALLMLHIFRFVGLAFIIPGVVSPDLPSGFAVDAAYGDLIAALLALLSLASLRTQAGLPLVWIFNVWGTLDLLNAIYQGNAWSMSPGQLGAAYFIPTLIVPLLFITHALVFRLLLERAPVEATA
jgi:hypothetical protein